MDRYVNEQDYLLKSLDFINERHVSCLNYLREAKEAMVSLQVDVPNITTPKLQETATKTFNHFSMEKSKFEGLIKEILEDKKWLQKILKIVRKVK